MSRYCPQCGKARKACICSWIQPVKSEIELIILQHPSEESHAKGTAKILTLSLENSRCIVDEDFTDNEILNLLLSEEGYECFLLYPGEDAIPVEEVVCHTAGSGKKIRLVLIDGTWRKAYKMFRLSSNLQALPLISISSGIRGNYRIRKAPSEESLSTVEAGYYALSALDNQTDYSPLIEAFEKMIDFQIAQMPEGVFEKNYK